MRRGQWLNVAALTTWFICAVPQLVAIAQGRYTGWSAILWLAAYLLYGAALVVFLGLGGVRARLGYYAPPALAAVLVTTAIAAIMLPVVAGQSTNSTPALLVIVAACLPYLAPSENATAPPATSATLTRFWIWSTVGVLVLVNVAILFTIDRQWTEALIFGFTMGGFMLFAAASSFLVRSEADARTQLAATNSQLVATRAMLVESSRAEERLRISRDLHDTLGHHLTALSLQLDVASRLSAGAAADHIRQAHAITRLLLGDVRDVVSRLREGRQPDLAQSIRELAGPEGPGPSEAGHYGVAIHVDLPDTLAIADSARSEMLLHCVQEIITNTTRHAHAQHLWIRLESRPDGIILHARDDGRGTDALECGNGLTGMRERFEQYSGHVEFVSGSGTGFQVRGFLPARALA